MRALEVCREEWHDHQRQAVRAAEQATRGNLIRPSKRRDFDRSFGFSEGGLCRLFRSPRRARERYATPELLEWWARNGHTTFEQWAIASGFRRKFLTEARRAGRA